MAVQVLEARAVHEAVVLLRHPGLAAGGDGLGVGVFDLGAAAGGEASQHLDALGGVADVALDEVAEARVLEQHGDDVLLDPHGRRVLAAELLVEGEAERAEEAAGRLDVLDRQVHENHPHGRPLWTVEPPGRSMRGASDIVR